MGVAPGTGILHLQVISWKWFDRSGAVAMSSFSVRWIGMFMIFSPISAMLIDSLNSDASRNLFSRAAASCIGVSVRPSAVSILTTLGNVVGIVAAGGAICGIAGRLVAGRGAGTGPEVDGGEGVGVSSALSTGLYLKQMRRAGSSRSPPLRLTLTSAVTDLRVSIVLGCWTAI